MACLGRFAVFHATDEFSSKATSPRGRRRKLHGPELTKSTDERISRQEVEMRNWPSLSEIIERRIAARKREAVKALREAETIAENEGGRLVVFGSLVEGNFDERSDIDVALYGVSKDRALSVASRIGTCFGMRDLGVDVVPEHFMSKSLKKRIEKHGRESCTLE
jgi:predicted nucleotidyltransferase